MTALLNPRHEKFAQEIAKGTFITKAHELAGYKSNDGNASNLASKPEIQERVKEIIENGAVRAEITVASLIAEIDEARKLAIKIKQPSAAIAATKEKGILSGKRIERSEIGEPGSFDDTTDDELRDMLVQDVKELGLGKTQH